MGWESYHATMYKHGKIDRKAECDAMMNTEAFDILKSVMVGSTYYAALRNKDTQKVIAAVTLTSTNAKDYCNFTYKGMDETWGPAESKCPNSILNLLTETDNEYAIAWRKRCRAYNASKSETLGKLPVGSVIEFEVNGETYRATKEYGTAHIRNGKLERIETFWGLDHNYRKASSRTINWVGYTIIHKASKEEAKKLLEERKAEISSRFGK